MATSNPSHYHHHYQSYYIVIYHLTEVVELFIWEILHHLCIPHSMQFIIFSSSETKDKKWSK